MNFDELLNITFTIHYILTVMSWFFNEFSILQRKRCSLQSCTITLCYERLLKQFYVQEIIIID